MSRFGLHDYSDRELVHLVADMSDDDGWTRPEEIAERAGIGRENARAVAMRLAWMRRYGIVEKNRQHPARWSLTEAGEEMVAGHKLNGGTLLALRKLKDHEIVWASHTLAGRFQEAAAPHAVMTRREWQREIRRRGRA